SAARGPQVEDGDDVAGADAAQRAGGAADADIDRRRHVPEQLEPGGHLLELERNAQPALDGLLAGDDHPEQHCQAERQYLQSEVLERPCEHAPRQRHVICTCCAGARSSRCSTSDRNRARNESASRPRSIWPSTTIEIRPVSSETTIATASFSSVRPIAARCRDPSSLLNFGLTVSGRKHAAAATRSSCTITAPSCSGEVGRKMLCNKS